MQKMIKNRTKNAIVFKDIAYSYKQLLQLSLRYKQQMSNLVDTIDKVLIFSENCPEYIFTIYATLRAKGVAVPVDVNSTEKELKYIIEDCRPSILVVAPEKQEFAATILKEINNYSPVLISFNDIDTQGYQSEPIVEIEMGEMDEEVSIIYTSGTTGSPKGVVLTYQNYWYNIDAVCNQVPIFNSESRVLLLLPLHHVFPFAGAMLAPLFAGSTIYIAENLASETLFRIFEEGKITVVLGVPRLYESIAKGIMKKINASFITKAIYNLAAFVGSHKFSKFIFRSVHKKFGGQIKHLVSGGAALPIGTATILKNLGLYVLEGYGMTECAPMIAFTRPGERKVGYCGRLLKGLELKLSEESGELLVKGPNVMKGYYNRLEETAQIIRNGWLHTGDIGELHNKFGLKITGRIKEIIVTSNGKNINPVEIENMITQSSVAIKEMAVVLHDDMIQAIIYPDMSVVRSNTGVSIEETIRPEIEQYNRSAMSYKRIKRFHIISHELPKTRLEKIQRFKLEELISSSHCPKPQDNESEKSETYLTLKSILENETNTKAWGEAHFEIDLALDSLGRVAMLSAIEEQFGVVIKESDFDNYQTLNKLSEFVELNAKRHILSNMSWKEIFEQKSEQLKIARSGFIHWFMTYFMKIFFHLLYNFRGSGKKNLPNQPCIFVCNHRSGFDGVFITSKLPWRTIKRSFVFAKKKHFNSKFSTYMAERNNVILMDINSNVKSSLQQMYQVLNQGNNLVIFPEGTRSKSGEMQDFKDSFAILSKELNIPVIPIAIKGSESATFRKIGFPRFFTRISVNFLDAIHPNQSRSIKDLRDKVASVIKKELNRKR